MTPEETARSTAGAVGDLASRFMVDAATYERGASLGFEGLAFYVAGRGGVLGDVDADVVTAAFAFWPAHTVRTAWEQGRSVLPPLESAKAFAECGHRWAGEHLPADAPCALLAELAGRVVDAAAPVGSTVFAGWRHLPVPDDPRARALHHMNALRELRHGLHAGAVLAAGLTPLEAVLIRRPSFVGIYGWPEPHPDVAGLRPRWEEAEAGTDRALGRFLEVLTAPERTAFAEAAAAVHASAT